MTDNIQPKEFLRSLFDTAIAAAQPDVAIAVNLPAPPKGKTYVIGAGKASAAMARTVEKNWKGPITGLVVTRYGYAVPCEQIEILEAAHPVPDEAGAIAARRIMELVTQAGEDDLVLCLISGGGSSLLPMPLNGITLEDKQAISRDLLKSGATIGEMNCVRRHLSAIKGGRLAEACFPAKVVNLLISDVPGDDPCDIASGPTVADVSTCDDALDIIRRYDINIPAPIRSLLEQGGAESIKPDHPTLPAISTIMVATPRLSLQAAAEFAIKAGVTPLILGDSIEGEARDVGKVLAGITHEVAVEQRLAKPPCVLLSGGETTVTVKGDGRGGRNVEFLLSFAIAIKGHEKIHAIAGDTDGVDGLEEIAGAYASPDTLARAWSAGLKPQDSLANNDGHSFFETLGDSIITGPTLTNVNDFRAILVL